ncbi:MAG: DUF4149 domain-containing protein [Chlamydiota bacterium]|nr:DUF4149 domain-containing protein [Chlamydiota bacterium]
MLYPFVHIIYVISLSLWFGAICFFSMIVAPRAFQSIPKNIIGSFLDRIFPAYNSWLSICLSLSFLSNLLLQWQPGNVTDRFNFFRLLLIFILCLLALYTRLVVLPAAHHAKQRMKDAIEEKEQKEHQKHFSKYHLQSTVINGLLFMGGLVIFILEEFI